MLFVIKHFTKYTLCCHTHLTTLSHLLAVGGVTATFNDLEWPLIQISRLRHYSTLTVSEMIDRVIVTMKYYAIYRMVLFPVTLSDPSESRHCSASNNATRQSCGRPTGSRMVYQRLHFQWPWMTSNPNFKRMPLFKVKYLRNGSTFRHNCKNTGPTQRCNFEWPRVIMSDLLKFPTRSACVLSETAELLLCMVW